MWTYGVLQFACCKHKGKDKRPHTKYFKPAAEAATGSALTAGASAGAANAAAAAPVGKQLSAKHSRKLEK